MNMFFEKMLFAIIAKAKAVKSALNSPSPRRASRLAPPLTVALCLIGFHVTAADPSVARYRHLFIVDGSQAMAPFAEVISRFAATNILNGFDGWAGRGEPIGVWAVKDRVLRDVLPIEYWTQKQALRISIQTAGFLQQYSYDGQSRFNTAIIEALTLARSSDAMTIILISDGRSQISGTAFDEQINTASASAVGRGGKLITTRLAITKGALVAWAMDEIDLTSAQPIAAVEKPAATPPPEPPVAQTKLPLATEKPLPPPPTLAKELTAPLVVAPLRYDDEDDKGKREGRRPIVIVRNEAPPAPVTQATPSAPTPTTPIEPKPTPSTQDQEKARAKNETRAAEPAIESTKPTAKEMLAASPQLPSTQNSQPAQPPVAPLPAKPPKPVPPSIQTQGIPNPQPSTPPAAAAISKLDTHLASEVPPARVEPEHPSPPAQIPPRTQPASPLSITRTAVQERPIVKPMEASKIADRNQPPTPASAQSTEAERSARSARIDELFRKLDSATARQNAMKRATSAPPAKVAIPESPSNTQVALAVPEPAKSRRALFIGLGLLGVAGLTLVFVVRNSKKPARPSLISQSIDNLR
ncbi:MAG: hypothetical protein EXS31_14770 [Pedosphaera sp.]|nr:hypothetical protein [Pedosphaera sp.]